MGGVLKRFFNNFWPFILMLVLLFIANANQIIHNHSLMIFNTDSYSQSLQFYLGGWEKFHQLDFSLWDWSAGYGANFLNHVYYFATSPFFYLTLFFDKEMIPYLFLYLNAFKLFLLFSFSYLWLKEFSQEKWIITVGSLVISFSGWVTFLYHYNLFLDGFVFYPLILWSIEKYYSKRSYLFSLFVGVLGIVHYYMLYMLIPFIILYSVMRYYVLKDRYALKPFFKEMLRLLILGLLGLGVSAFILLPSINIVLSMPRLNGTFNLFETLGRYDVYRYFSTLFSPTVQWDNPSYFINLEKDAGFGWGGGISVFSFYLFPLLGVHLFFLKETRIKTSSIAMYSGLFFFSIFTVFYRVFQGTVDVRWYYMFLFMNVYVLVFILEDFSRYGISKQRIILSALVNSVILMGLFYISSTRAYANIEQIDLLKNIVIYGLILFVIYTSILYFQQFKLLLVVVSIEAIVSFVLPLTTQAPIAYDEFLNRYHSELDSSSALNNVLEMDESYYRIIRNSIAGYNLNEPFANQYKGITFYESLYNFETTDFISRFTDRWLLPYIPGRFNTNFITSVKYYLKEDGMSEAPFGFEYLKTLEETDIYQNKYPITLGYSLSSTINTEVFKSLPIEIQDQLWLNTIVLDSSVVKDFSLPIEYEFIGNTGEDAYLFLSENDVEKLNGSVLMIVNHGTPYLTITRYYQNETKMEYHYLYNYFQLYNAYDDSFEAFELSATNPYGQSYNVDVYATQDLNAYDHWYQNLNQFYDVKIDKDNISATINIPSELEWVFTSVPFDKGWKLSVDGVNYPYEKVNLGFVGFKLPEGEHQIELSYLPPFFNLGLVITGISTVLLGVLTELKNRKLKLIKVK